MVVETVPIVCPPNPHNIRYLETRSIRWEHLLEIPDPDDPCEHEHRCDAENCI